MKLSLFYRAILGCLIFVVLISVVSIFSIMQLNRVNKVTHSIILLDNTLLSCYEKLIDCLFLETRNAKKFIILQDAVFHDGYRQAKEDFDRVLYEAVLATESPQAKERLYEINRLHYRLGVMFREETAYLTSARQYAREWYAAEKEKKADAMLEDLKLLRSASEKTVIRKVMDLSERGGRASKIALIITAISLLIGLVLSIVATRSITVPLAVIKRKTKEIAGGDLEGNLAITSPPEIAELADSLNFMRGKLKEVDTMKSDFFALMSHELRTPLTSIKEGTNILLEGLAGAITDRQQRLLAIIAEESNRLIELVTSLLDLTRMQAGMMPYHFTIADFNGLVHRTVTEILPLAESKNIWIEKNLAKVPLIKIDEERILQVLRNLVGNAVKFTPEGGRVELTVGPDDNQVSVVVRDTGPGISSDQAGRIFDKFQQGSASGGNRLKGSGLGLAIVKHIIQTHGGKVWVESEEGKGSSFCFVLPG